MATDSRFKILMLRATAMILWWVGWRMDKLDTKSFNETIKGMDALREELEKET
jgi:hypothetical protein